MQMTQFAKDTINHIQQVQTTIRKKVHRKHNTDERPSTNCTTLLLTVLTSINSDLSTTPHPFNPLPSRIDALEVTYSR